MVRQLVAAVVGAWLMVAPALLGHDGALAASDRIAGPLALSLGIIAASAVTRPVGRLNLLVAGWLLLAPWLLGGPPAALVSNLLAALVLIWTALGARSESARFGGGWSALWRPASTPTDQGGAG